MSGIWFGGVKAQPHTTGHDLEYLFLKIFEIFSINNILFNQCAGHPHGHFRQKAFIE